MTPRAARQPIASQRQRDSTSKGRAEARERRRQEGKLPGLHGYAGDEFLRTPLPGDPLEHLEAMRRAYIAELENCARLAPEISERAAILARLLKFSSLGRIRVDVSAQLGRLAPEADLRSLSDDQLAAIMQGDVPALPAPATAKSPSHTPEKSGT